MPRPTVAVALPPDEAAPVTAELRDAGFTAVLVDHPDQLAALLQERRDVAVAILDGEGELDLSLEYYARLHEEGRSIPALMVVSPTSLSRMEEGGDHDEYFTRPYTAEAIRWRVEAMCIRSVTVDDGTSDGVLTGDVAGANDWASRATVFVVFNPKGGVGKTTIATNLAAVIQARGDQRVLLVDADTVTGHIPTSLGIEGVPTIADAWRDEAETGEPAAPLAQLATEHTSGMRILSFTNSPLAVELLEPGRISAALETARRAFDVIVIDLHPSYSALNRALFRSADRILLPVTPDVPALRAAVQLRDVAVEMGIRDRLALIVNRANSGVSVEDMERTIALPAIATIRSGGLLFVRAANEGRTVIERYPKEKVTEDFTALANALLRPAASASTAEPVTSRSGLWLFGRAKEQAGT
jgi:Flp pilus assembly CpaE family ATPase